MIRDLLRVCLAACLCLFAGAALGQPTPVYKIVLYQASTVAALRAYAPTTMPGAAHIAGYTTDGDGGGGDYQWASASTATDDGCATIKPTALTTGRWIAVINGTHFTPQRCGATGDGTTDDSVAVQAAINAAAAAGTVLWFDATHLYKVTTTLNVASPIHMEGAWRYGFWVTGAANASYCTWGLTTTANVTLLNVTAASGIIRNICMQLGASTGNVGVASSATAGAAIQLAPPNLTSYQSGWHIEGNTILHPYDGITLNGVGYTATCCGAGTTADGVSIVRNTIVNPADVGISIGKNTAGASTVGITLTDNAIGCVNATSQASGTGIALYDGGIAYDGTENGPEACNVGIKIVPGTVSGVGQNAQFNPATGVLGDQSASHDFLVQPATSLGTVAFSECHQCWASGTSATDNEILISNVNNGIIEGFNFIGGNFHSAANQSVPVVDIEGYASGALQHIHFVGTDIACWQSGTCTAALLKIAGTSAGQPRNITYTGGHVGINIEAGNVVCNTGISIAGVGTAYVAITGVDLQNCTTPLSVSGNVATGMSGGLVVKGNVGLNPVFQQSAPTNPTGTTSTAAYKMMGIGVSFTPKTSGNMSIAVIGAMGNSTVNDGVAATITYGTGTAPTNGAALTGSTCTNGNPAFYTSIANATAPYSLVCNLGGLTIGTTYWLDLTVEALTGGTASVVSNTVTVTEQ